jgi:hypothetical protein
VGLFSSKYIHNVGTSIQRVVQDDGFVDPYTLAIMDSALNKVDMIDSILETSLTSMGVRANNFYNFVKKNHPTKAPNSEIVFDTKYSEAVETYIKSLHPGTIPRFAYSRYGPPNAYHEAWESLIKNDGYDPATGIIGSLTQDKTTCILKNITVELPVSMRTGLIPWTVENWISVAPQSVLGYHDTFGQVNPAFSALPVIFKNISSPRVKVTYFKKVELSSFGQLNFVYDFDRTTPSPTITEEFYTFDLLNFGGDGEYYQCSYTVGTTRRFFTYKYKSGSISSLDNVLESSVPAKKIGQFYPNIYYRLNKTPTTDPIYKKMSRRLDMDHEKLAKGINDNPDIGDVQSALLNFGINADSTHEKDCFYLFDFFKNIRQVDNNRPWNPSDYLSAWSWNPGTVDIGFNSLFRKQNRSKNAISIKDSAFRYGIVYESVHLETKAGKIGPVGFSTGGKDKEERLENETIESYPDGPSSIVKRKYAVPYRYYRKQISLSFWEEVRIYDLTMVYDVAGSNGEYKTTLGDNDGELCLVPLDRSLIKEYSLKDQHELIVRGFNFVFNSYVIQKVKWYQQGWFADLLQIVGIVLLFYGFYTGELFIGLSGLTVNAAAQLILQRIIVMVAVQVGVKLFVKIAGPELAFIAALAAMAFGFYGESLSFISPDQLLNLAAMVFDGVNTYMSGAFQDLQAEMDTFLSMKTEGEKELERAMDLLDSKVNPVAPILLGETPDQFLYRTTIFGVSEFTKLNQVSDFVERSLYLPTTGSSFEMM